MGVKLKIETMKVKLLRRLRRRARRHIEVTFSIHSPEKGYYFFNNSLLRSYCPTEKYDDYPWLRLSCMKYYHTVEELKEGYWLVLWSETKRLFEIYKTKLRDREMRKAVKEMKSQKKILKM